MAVPTGKLTACRESVAYVSVGQGEVKPRRAGNPRLARVFAHGPPQ